MMKAETLGWKMRSRAVPQLHSYRHMHRLFFLEIAENNWESKAIAHPWMLLFILSHFTPKGQTSSQRYHADGNINGSK